MDITAIVLAGGKGSRMNFQEKAWMLHRGKPLLCHVIDSIRPQVNTILISRNATDDARYDELPYACFADVGTDDDSIGLYGPLSGISVCAKHITALLTLVVPCDTPRLPDNLVSLLFAGLEDASIAVAHDGNQEQPLVFLARTQSLQKIDSYLQSGRRSVKGWLEGTDHNVVYFKAGSQEFENINSVDQLA